MKTLHLYVTRQVMGTLLMTVAVFTFVLMLGNVLKEILGLLVNRQATPMMVLQALGLLIPYVMVFALPMGLLTASLLVFGRFSADNELTAVRAGGVSLISLVTPVLLLSVALSGVAAVINLQVAPYCRLAYKDMLFKIGLGRTGSFIPEKTYIKDFPDCIVYVSEVDGTNLEDILIYRLRDDKIESYNRADYGVIQINPTNNVITVVLTNSYHIFFREDRRLPQTLIESTVEFTYTNVNPRAQGRKVDLSDMTFFQLMDELKDLERRMESSSPVAKVPGEALREQMRQLKSQRKIDLTLPVRVQIHRQVAFSFACIGFTLVGIPLGIRAHRRETSFGIAVALILVVVYYSFFILGQSLETRPDLAPHLILWVPNFLFQAVGVTLLWRANRGV
jgi:lipopolysaccharide export system permease protein